MLSPILGLKYKVGRVGFFAQKNLQTIDRSVWGFGLKSQLELAQLTQKPVRSVRSVGRRPDFSGFFYRPNFVCLFNYLQNQIICSHKMNTTNIDKSIIIVVIIPKENLL